MCEAAIKPPYAVSRSTFKEAENVSFTRMFSKLSWKSGSTHEHKCYSHCTRVTGV